MIEDNVTIDENFYDRSLMDVSYDIMKLKASIKYHDEELEATEINEHKQVFVPIAGVWFNEDEYIITKH